MVMALGSGSAFGQLPLINGGSVGGSISPSGDVDSYTFHATVGETVALRGADPLASALDPMLQVYDPNGTHLGTGYNADVAAFSFVAASTGTYTLLVADWGANGNPNTDTGSYEIQYAKMPGANELGNLINGGSVISAIALGDIDTFVFDAVQGESIRLRSVDLGGTSLDPSISVFLPNGTHLTSGHGADVAAAEFQAPVTGTYTLAVSDWGANGNPITGTGIYEIHFARMSGANEHGALTNGGTVVGEISPGDLDTFVFDAVAGESVRLRGVDPAGSSLDPVLSVFLPSGAHFSSGYGGSVGAVNFQAPVTGTYTLLIADWGANGNPITGTGPYEVHYARIPGANEHGALVNGTMISGDITLGDLDTFTLTVNAGAHIDLEVTDPGLATLDPMLQVFDPSGVHIANAYGTDVASYSFVAAMTGTYTLLVSDYGANGNPITGTGAYGIYSTGNAGTAYCFGGATCPCAASGAPGEGCANTGGFGGATLAATGNASLSNDSFGLSVAGVPGNKAGLILSGANQVNGGFGNPVGDGLLCVGGQTLRSQIQVTSAGSTTFNSFQGSGFGTSSMGLGVATNYQFWYRDPSNTCSGMGFNFSNAWATTWLP